jgi:quercetin dioxygenase-like cupin family protein
MTRRATLLGLVVAALTLQAFPGFAQVGTLRLTPTEIAGLANAGAGAGTSGVSGIRSTVLFGDPTKVGPYTIEIRVPPNTRIAAHRHRDDRTAVVVSGLWNLGYGDSASDAAAKTLPPGSFYTEPGGVAHFARTGDQPAIVYISGYGPTDTTYVDSTLTPPRP